MVMSCSFATAQQVQKITQRFNICMDTAIKLEAIGNIQYEYWNGKQVVVETTIKTNFASNFAVDYAISQGHFRLETIIKPLSIVIKPRKINTILLVEGQRHITKTSYKVLIPEMAWYDKPQTLGGK